MIGSMSRSASVTALKHLLLVAEAVNRGDLPAEASEFLAAAEIAETATAALSAERADDKALKLELDATAASIAEQTDKNARDLGEISAGRAQLKRDRDTLTEMAAAETARLSEWSKDMGQRDKRLAASEKSAAKKTTGAEALMVDAEKMMGDARDMASAAQVQHDEMARVLEKRA